MAYISAYSSILYVNFAYNSFVCLIQLYLTNRLNFWQKFDISKSFFLLYSHFYSSYSFSSIYTSQSLCIVPSLLHEFLFNVRLINSKVSFLYDLIISSNGDLFALIENWLGPASNDFVCTLTTHLASFFFILLDKRNLKA